MKKTHIGSKLDDLLKEDRLLEVATATATKRVIAHQIAVEMKRRHLTKTAMASRMKTSRAALDRLLDPDNPSVTIGTLERAAAALNRRLTVELR
jgi:DNA-binding Xre family transcriptional regulator